MLEQINLIKKDIINILKEYKATNALLVNLDKASIADFIIVASGTSNRHIVTLKDKISSQIKAKYGITCLVEGEEQANWIILDFEHIIIHLFRPEVRDYYEIDNIWDASKITTLNFD